MTKEGSEQQPHWDREQWAKDEPVDKSSPEKDKTWNRHDWASDEQPTPGDGEGGTGHSPGETGPTGRGMPSGEGHWERVDKEG